MSKLEDSIENLYSAFCDANKPRVIEGCDCCIDENQIAKLLSTPLRQIEPDDISSYASSAFLTVGETSDYLYFLPRILEISAKDEWWWPDIEVTGRAVFETHPLDWPALRKQALDEFLQEVLGELIEKRNVEGIDSWLCAIARMGIDVSPFLRIMETSPAAVAEYYRANCRKLDTGKLANEFWDRPNEGHDVIIEWLRREDITKLGNEYWP